MTQSPRPELIALLDDVKENPSDLTPWLVLCDWLEENGNEAEQARGEYCRLCFDKLGKKTYASDWEKGERRRNLYRTYHQAWFGPLAELNPKINRGLLQVTISPTPLCLEAVIGVPELWAWVETLHLTGPFAQLKLCGTAFDEVMTGVRSIHLHRSFVIRAEELSDFAAWPHAARLRGFYLSLRTINRTQAQALAQSPYLASLEWLGVGLQRGIPLRLTREERRAIDILKDAYGDRLDYNH